MITEIGVNEKEKWNKTVHSFTNYDVFYLNEYVSAFMKENESNGEPVLLYYENGSDRAMNVLFKRDIALDEHMKARLEKGHYFDLITPYGYGGFWGRVVDYDALNQNYNEYCQSRHYVCEFVRFELFSDYYKHYDGVVETRTHNVVRSLDMSIDEIWLDFKQKVRKNVKRAMKNNLKIIIENTGEDLEDFFEIYYSTMNRSNAEQEYYFSKGFYETLNQMRDNIMYFHVEYEGKIISTELVIYGSENAYSYLGGTNREYFDLRPNDFLKYEIIKWVKAKGLKNFVLGGGYGSDDGIFQYKACLAPNGVKDFYIGRKILDKTAYDSLCEIRKVKSNSMNLKEIGFFPEYRGNISLSN
ncbi:GNAT family N-acetyltransferase [Hungatella sp. SB206]|uniref:GNAT family N-acetyltransferase n=1 Tax=Hungatella sp. SB206 TaxID=2937758 RepID=UPI003DAA0E40